eukprot:scaffold28607_cov64-Phaeocystis_antarctica.AAC.2
MSLLAASGAQGAVSGTFEFPSAGFQPCSLLPPLVPEYVRIPNVFTSALNTRLNTRIHLPTPAYCPCRLTTLTCASSAAEAVDPRPRLLYFVSYSCTWVILSFLLSYPSALCSVKKLAPQDLLLLLRLERSVMCAAAALSRPSPPTA